MPNEIRRIDVRRFDASKMQKLNLLETSRFFCDVYCLEAGQAQKPHRHDGADKVYLTIEGEVVVRVGEESASLPAGAAALAPAGSEHGLENRGPARAAVFAYRDLTHFNKLSAAPNPSPKGEGNSVSLPPAGEGPGMGSISFSNPPSHTAPSNAGIHRTGRAAF